MQADKDMFDIVILTDNRYINPTSEVIVRK